MSSLKNIVISNWTILNKLNQKDDLIVLLLVFELIFQNKNDKRKGGSFSVQYSIETVQMKTFKCYSSRIRYIYLHIFLICVFSLRSKKAPTCTVFRYAAHNIQKHVTLYWYHINVCFFLSCYVLYSNYK